MKHVLTKKLKREIKELRAEIRLLKKRKHNYTNPIAELLDTPIDVEALKKAYHKNK